MDATEIQRQPAAATDVASPEPPPDRPRTGRRRVVWVLAALVAAVVVAVVFPGVVGDRALTITNLVLLAMPSAMALTVLTGTGGMISVGHGALIGIGGFVGVVAADSGVPFLVVLLASAVVGLLVGVAIGLPSLRMGGFYLLLSTLAMAYIVSYLLAAYQEEAAGGRFQQTGFSLPTAEIGGLALVDEQQWYVLLVVFAALTAFGWHRLMRTKTGRAWLAVREREELAPLVGIDVVRSKLLVFALSSAIVTAAGCLAAYHTTLVTSEQFTGIAIPISYYAMIVTGGLGSLTGAAIGAVIVVALPFVLPDLISVLPDGLPFKETLDRNGATVALFVYGLLIVVFMWLEPKGIVGLAKRLGGAAAARVRTR